MTTHDTTRVRSEDPGEEKAGPTRKGPPAPVAFLRNVWRQLTSMRIALVLLFLLALASVPGALLPQWSLNEAKTAQYLLDNGEWAVWLNRLGFFEVFASPWYSAIYLLLFISLVGCLTPRTWEFVGHLRQPPVKVPRNLARLPLHDEVVVAGTPTAVAEEITAGLKRWRKTRRDEDEGVLTLSAEKGFVREAGNLIFHLSLLGLLVAIAIGSMFGFEGSVLISSAGTGVSTNEQAQEVGDGNSGFCSTTTISYDNFRPGLMIDGTELPPFCVQVDGFEADYLDNGMAVAFRTHIRYQLDPANDGDTWQEQQLEVNDPIRLEGGQRLYLLGHGYSPIFTVTWPDGTQQTRMTPFQPEDAFYFTSQGAVKFTDPPLQPGEEITDHQLAVVGIFAPTAFVHQGVMTSTYPAPESPGAAVRVFVGDLGLETGRSQSVFAIDEQQEELGLLNQVASQNLAPGETITLDDGTTIEFSGFREFVSLQTSYDPAQGWALVFAILLLIGLMMSLTIKRRRVWFRIIPEGTGSRVQVGGLARTDQAGYGEEFEKLVLLAGRPVVGGTEVDK